MSSVNAKGTKEMASNSIIKDSRTPIVEGRPRKKRAEKFIKQVKDFASDHYKMFKRLMRDIFSE